MRRTLGAARHVQRDTIPSRRSLGLLGGALRIQRRVFRSHQRFRRWKNMRLSSQGPPLLPRTVQSVGGCPGGRQRGSARQWRSASSEMQRSFCRFTLFPAARTPTYLSIAFLLISSGIFSMAYRRAVLGISDLLPMIYS